MIIFIMKWLKGEKPDTYYSTYYYIVLYFGKWQLPSLVFSSCVSTWTMFPWLIYCVPAVE